MAWKKHKLEATARGDDALTVWTMDDLAIAQNCNEGGGVWSYEVVKGPFAATRFEGEFLCRARTLAKAKELAKEWGES